MLSKTVKQSPSASDGLHEFSRLTTPRKPTRRSLHTGRLVLTPKDPYYSPDDLRKILRMLREIGFIGAPLDNSDRRHLLGDNFMRLVSFVGCSPHIRLEPTEPAQPFCHLIVDGPSEHPRLLYGKNTTAPRCGSCRRRLQEWLSSFATWHQEPDSWQVTCPHCGHNQDPATYDFRQSAGCGRLFLYIENIFPQEAIPAPTLLDLLQENTGQAWCYFYQQDG